MSIIGTNSWGKVALIWLVQGKCVCETISSKTLWWFLDIFIDRHKKHSKSYIQVSLKLIPIKNSSIKELKNIGLATVDKYSNYRVKKRVFRSETVAWHFFSPCSALLYLPRLENDQCKISYPALRAALLISMFSTIRKVFRLMKTSQLLPMHYL
jgi:hypothetical protein